MRIFTGPKQIHRVPGCFRPSCRELARQSVLYVLETKLSRVPELISMLRRDNSPDICKLCECALREKRVFFKNSVLE